MSEEIIKYIIIRSGYTAAQKRATYKWNDKNKEKLSEYRRTYHAKAKSRLLAFQELVQIYDAIEIGDDGEMGKS